jgi:hypothetical protein
MQNGVSRRDAKAQRDENSYERGRRLKKSQSDLRRKFSHDYLPPSLSRLRGFAQDAPVKYATLSLA